MRLKKRGLLATQLCRPNALRGCVLWLPSDGAVESDGASQFTAANSEYLSKASNASLQTGDIDFTVAIAVRLDSKATNQAIVSKWPGAGGDENREYSLEYLTASDRFSFTVDADGAAGGETAVAADSLGAPSINTWYWIVAWHDSVNNTINIQVNDGVVDSAAFAGGVFAGTDPLNIGVTQAGSAYLDGRAALAGFWKRILSAAERTALYAAGAGLAYNQLSASLKTSLVSYWNLDEPSGQRNDSHGTNHLTDNNTVTAAVGPNTHAAGDGAAISRWVDGSGQANHALQTTPASRPIYKIGIVNGKAVTRFSSQYLNCGDPASLNFGTGDFSLLAVFQTADASNQSIVGKGDAEGGASQGYRLTPRSTGVLWSIVDPGTEKLAQGTGTVVGAAWHVGALVVSRAVSALQYVDGAADGSVDISAQAGTTTDSNRNLLLGYTQVHSSGALTEPLIGDIAEVVIYNRALSAAERSRVERYLGRRYGVGVV